MVTYYQPIITYELSPISYYCWLVISNPELLPSWRSSPLVRWLRARSRSQRRTGGPTGPWVEVLPEPSGNCWGFMGNRSLLWLLMVDDGETDDYWWWMMVKLMADKGLWWWNWWVMVKLMGSDARWWWNWWLVMVGDDWWCLSAIHLEIQLENWESTHWASGGIWPSGSDVEQTGVGYAPHP